MALFRSPSDRKQIGIIAERMFDKNRPRFMSAYFQETERAFGYIFVDNRPNTPSDKQVLETLSITFFMGNCKPQTAKCHVTTALRSSVAKCRGSWVVGVGVGKCRGLRKNFSKKIKKQKGVNFMKRKSLRTYQSYSLECS